VTPSGTQCFCWENVTRYDVNHVDPGDLSRWIQGCTLRPSPKRFAPTIFSNENALHTFSCVKCRKLDVLRYKLRMEIIWLCLSIGSTDCLLVSEDDDFDKNKSSNGQSRKELICTMKASRFHGLGTQVYNTPLQSRWSDLQAERARHDIVPLKDVPPGVNKAWRHIPRNLII
jgi:hypothetical protein